MPLPKEPYFKIFDPRIGQDYRYSTKEGRIFSSLEHEFLVILYYPGRTPKSPLSLDVEEFDDLIATSMIRLGKTGFFSLAPLTTDVRTSQQVDLSQIDEMGGTAVGYFGLEMRLIRQYMKLRRRLVTYEEWIVGSCKESFKKPREPKLWYRRLLTSAPFTWDFESLLLQIQNVQCLSLFGETGELSFFSRIYEGIDQLIDPLSQKLAKMIRNIAS